MALQSCSVSHPRWEGPPPSFPPAKYGVLCTVRPSRRSAHFQPTGLPLCRVAEEWGRPSCSAGGGRFATRLLKLCKTDPLSHATLSSPLPLCPKFSQRAKGCSDLQLGVPIRSLRQPQSLPRGPSLRRKLQGTSQAYVVRKKSFFAWDGAV